MNKDYTFYQKAIEKMFYIVDKDMHSIPYLLNAPQLRMLKELNGSNRDIILKSRKEGISSLILALFTVDFLSVENINCVVISHEDKATQRLFERVHYYIESMKKTWPGELPYTLKYKSKTELWNLTKNSKFYVGTAGARAFGRGDDIHNLHISELPQWPEEERMMVGLTNAVTVNGRIIIEATANGIGDYFYKMWVRSSEGISPYRNHFIPWFELLDYVMPVTYPLLELIPEEQELVNRYHLTKEQIAWRRWKINEMNGDWRDPATWNNFNQEFPSNPEEAFIISGNPVFSPAMLKRYLVHCRKPALIGDLIGYDPVSVEPNEKGYLKVYKEPKEFHAYAIGVDVSEGKVIGDEGRQRDASCAQVFDKTTYEQVAVLHGMFDPDRLGRMLDLLGRYYNEALIGVERNAVGIAPLTILRDLNYANLHYRERIGQITDKVTAELGWLTDSHSKELMISEAITLLRDSRIEIYDEPTIGEMMSFVRDSDGNAKAAKSAKDDRVMALLIALQMLKRARVQSNVNDIERPDSDREKGFWLDGQSFNANGMPTHPDNMGGSDIYQGDEF